MARSLGDVVDELHEDGSATIAFDVADRNSFLRWLLTFRGQAAVLDPPTVADELDGLRQRVAALYVEDP